MGGKTAIQWTSSTWNPITGCTRVSEGCRSCYSERLSARLQRMGVRKYVNGFALTLHPESLNEPLRWKDPRRVFVCSMSDLFHSRVPDFYISQVFEAMSKAPRHTYQLLTKRPLRMANFQEKYFPEGFPDHIWAGTSVEDNRVVKRVDFLRRVKVKSGVRFLSCEPLVGPIDRIDLNGVGWVIAGGESGPNFRPVEEDWLRWLRDECVIRGVPFFLKQLGGLRPKSKGRLLDGREWNGMPPARLPVSSPPEGSQN